jgi:hypothetical protein
MLGDTIDRIHAMGRPNEVLQSPFAKLQAVEERAAAAAATSGGDNASTSTSTTTSAAVAAGAGDGMVTPIKRTNGSTNSSSSGVHRSGGGEIQYEDFSRQVGVFSFISLYKEPLPACPAVCLSGQIRTATGVAFAATPGSAVLTAPIWKNVYAIITSDGYLHVLHRGKSEVPDITINIKVLLTYLLTYLLVYLFLLQILFSSVYVYVYVYMFF